MSAAKIIGILLIAAGVAGLLYGGFTYTKESHTAKLGPLARNRTRRSWDRWRSPFRKRSRS